MTDTTTADKPEALEEQEIRKLAAIGPVYAPDDRVERRPSEYRRELEGQFVRGYRAAEQRLLAARAKEGKACARLSNT